MTQPSKPVSQRTDSTGSTFATVSPAGDVRRPDDARITVAIAESRPESSPDEVEVLQECVGLFNGLDDSGCRRVLAYLNDRFGSRG